MGGIVSISRSGIAVNFQLGIVSISRSGIAVNLKGGIVLYFS